MKRRMISDDIVSSGKFLRLPPSTQALYMHCVVNTDDDGIVDMFTIMRMVGAKEDDVVILTEREFVTPLDPKEFIFWVTGFQDFNQIRPNIKQDSKYLSLLLAKVEGVTIVKSTRADDSKRRYSQLKEQRKLEKQGKVNAPTMLRHGTKQEHHDDPPSLVLSSLVLSKELGESEREEKTKNVTNELVEWIQYFNEVTGKSFGAAISLQDNFTRCRKTYSLKQMKEAVDNLSSSSWDVLREEPKPSLLINQLDQKRQPVDRIGELLNQKVKSRFQ